METNESFDVEGFPLAQRKPPVYEDFLGQPSDFITGTQRFYIDIRESRYSYLHHHNFAELSFFYEETGIETVNGVSHQLVPGTVSVVLPYQMHIIRGNPDRPLVKYCCMFNIQLLNDLADDPWFAHQLYGVGTRSPSHAYFSGNEKERVRDTFAHLLEEYREVDRPGRV